ncbi:MAG: hypothetical protein QOF70_5362 [Acetobacteraceae bacterium]|nr:hypothetical protein [Acetobacteraceae bacterium]
MKASFMILPMLLLSAKAAPRRIVEAKPEAEPGLPGPNGAESAVPATSAPVPDEAQ